MLKQQDLYLLLGVAALFAPFIAADRIYETYIHLNQNHGFVVSFVQFSILSTLGEIIGLRIKTGSYLQSNYGILPRALVYGFLGVIINAVFIIFASGVPTMLAYSGMLNASEAFLGELSVQQVFVAFAISVFINIIFAPVMMTLYKIADIHILNTGGSVRGLFSAIDVGEVMSAIDWRIQWNLLFKITIPLFWIPAHTITFLLPLEIRVLFAAMLGLALGIFMSISSAKSNQLPTSALAE